MVVFPFVPVTPTSRSDCAGSPRTAAEKSASAARASGTCTHGPEPSGGSSETIAAAPFFRAASTKRFPSVTAPRIATNSVPGASRRESYVTSVTGSDGSPCRRASGTRRKSSPSLTACSSARAE